MRIKINRRQVFAGLGAAFFIALLLIVRYVEIKSASVVPILMYHSINTNEEKSSLYVSPKTFEKQMAFLAKYEYKTVSPDEVISYMKGKKRMPPKTVAITVDDGFYNFYKYAFPVLKKYNLKATIFIITGKIGRPGRLGWNELREMSDSGLVTIGSHTKSHPWLPEVSVDEKRLNEELAGSKNILQIGLRKSVDYICYPNGGFNDVVRDAARDAGYKGAFTTNPVRSSAIDDIYAIRRLKMSSSSKNLLILWGKISRYYAWYKETR